MGPAAAAAAAAAGEGEAALPGDTFILAGASETPGPGRARAPDGPEIFFKRSVFHSWRAAFHGPHGAEGHCVGFLFGVVGAERAPSCQPLLFSLISEMLTRWKEGMPVPSNSSHLLVPRPLRGQPSFLLRVPFYVVLKN